MANIAHPEASTIHRYWVIGGTYETLDFDRLVEGTESVFGPFGSVEAAQRIWRSVTEETRCQATVRYVIATESTRMS
jgi:hypothetical protein